jgi:hypothetical protein
MKLARILPSMEAGLMTGIRTGQGMPAYGTGCIDQCSGRRRRI